MNELRVAKPVSIKRISLTRQFLGLWCNVRVVCEYLLNVFNQLHHRTGALPKLLGCCQLLDARLAGVKGATNRQRPVQGFFNADKRLPLQRQ